MAVTKIDSRKNASAVAEMPTKAEKNYEGLTRQQLVEIYRLMYLSRRLDDREKVLKNQQKIFFQISERRTRSSDFGGGAESEGRL